MKKGIYIAVLIGCIGVSLNASQFDIGISGSDRGISGFTFSIGDYYHVPVQEVVVIERTIPRDEMSVVYFLAQKSHRDARYISDLRVHGASWWDITLRLGLDPRTIYVIDSRRDYGPPYGVAYGYKSNKHRLRDIEIIDLVNTRFISDYHRISPDEVIERRRGGERYMNIDEHYRTKKAPQYQDRYDDRGVKNDKGHGNNQGYDDHRGSKNDKWNDRGHGNGQGRDRN